jgi:hypothetical protein
MREPGLRFAIAEVEALWRVKKAVGCYSDAYLAAFEEVLGMLRADLERGCQPSTSELMSEGRGR